MNPLTPTTSRTIDFLRVILLISVIIMHYPTNLGDCSSTDLSNLDYSLKNLGEITYFFIQVLLNKVISANAVPLFFVFSGYLFYLNFETKISSYTRKVAKRIHTLLIPYLLWNLIAFLFYAAINCLGPNHLDLSDYFYQIGELRILWDSETWGTNDINWLGMQTPWNGPIDLPLWFIRNLMVMVVLSPIIYIYIKYLKIAGLILLALFYITGVFVNIPGINITSVFFFSLGAYPSILGKDLIIGYGGKKIVMPLFILCFLILIFSIITGEKDLYLYIRPIYILTYTISTLYLGRDFVKACPNMATSILTYSNCVFFIYASHILIITIFSFVMLTYPNNWINLLLYIIGISSIWIIGIVSFKLINTKIPVVGVLLNGGRI